jgi:hypothetical protein
MGRESEHYPLFGTAVEAMALAGAHLWTSLFGTGRSPSQGSKLANPGAPGWEYAECLLAAETGARREMLERTVRA